MYLNLTIQTLQSIRIKSLKKNLQSLAQEILDKCNLIHPSQLEQVEQSLLYLQKRTVDSRDSIGIFN